MVTNSRLRCEDKRKKSWWRTRETSWFLWSGQNVYLLYAGLVQEGEQRAAEGRGGALVVDHGHLDAHRVATHAQADERDLDDGQQELEAQRAIRREGEEGGEVKRRVLAAADSGSARPYWQCEAVHQPWHPPHAHHGLDHQGGDVPPLGQHVSGSHLPVGWRPQERNKKNVAYLQKCIFLTAHFQNNGTSSEWLAQLVFAEFNDKRHMLTSESIGEVNFAKI